VRPRKIGFWYRLAEVILRPFLTVFTKRDWRGGEHIPPTGGVVLVTNHISWFDPLAYAHYVFDHGRLPRFLAKDSVFRIFFVGRLLRGAGQIPVYRGSTDASKAFSAGVDAVRRGEALVVYPDGTITRDPDLWPMVGKTGAARIALTAGVDVVPIAQWGAQDVLAPYAKRLRLLPRKTMHLVAGPPVDLDDLRGRPITSDLLREATARIMAELTELLEGIRGERAPVTRFDPKAAGLPLTGNPEKPREQRRPA
jgi:1-acyl-sn-glycerol-3-phosphate acyltransferase